MPHATIADINKLLEERYGTPSEYIAAFIVKEYAALKRFAAATESQGPPMHKQDAKQ